MFKLVNISHFIIIICTLVQTIQNKWKLRNFSGVCPCKKTKKHHFQIADNAMSNVYTHTLVVIPTHAISYFLVIVL